jgi:hypothetical protein
MARHVGDRGKRIRTRSPRDRGVAVEVASLVSNRRKSSFLGLPFVTLIKTAKVDVMSLAKQETLSRMMAWSPTSML